MKKFTKKNPRFVWIIGSIREQFPDLPELEAGPCVLWDRQQRKPVMTLHPEYAQSFCLELTTSPAAMPYTNLENWWNTVSNSALKSEGMKPTK